MPNDDVSITGNAAIYTRQYESVTRDGVFFFLFNTFSDLVYEIKIAKLKDYSNEKIYDITDNSTKEYRPWRWNYFYIAAYTGCGFCFTILSYYIFVTTKILSEFLLE